MSDVSLTSEPTFAEGLQGFASFCESCARDGGMKPDDITTVVGKLRDAAFVVSGLQKVRDEARARIAELERIISDAQAAPDAVTQTRAWKTIDSAPADGTLILVFAPGTEFELSDIVCTCAWHEDAGFCVCELRYPTHWMPLPEPPAEFAAQDYDASDTRDNSAASEECTQISVHPDHIGALKLLDAANTRIAELERIINDAQAAPDAVEAACDAWGRELWLCAPSAMQVALTAATLNNDARVKELERERDKALIDVMNLRVLLDGFQDDRATDLEARYARIAELKAALNKIVEEGTITTTTRVGDMYDLVTGYEDSQDIHPLAEIARAALKTTGSSCFRSPPQGMPKTGVCRAQGHTQ
jgi:hypothetical protein